MTTLAKKISIGSINGVRAGFKGVTETTHVARIYGNASAVEAKDGGSMGISQKFTGRFVGVNADGEETFAPVCFLIAPADSMLSDAVKQAGGNEVEFAFDFYVVPNPTAVLGYEYKVKPVIELAKAEPLMQLAAKFAGNPGPQKKQLAISAEPSPTNAEPEKQPEMATEGAAEEAPKSGKKHK